jgi:hypothetical protein
VLAKLAIALFGIAEWVIRLPSILGALLYLSAVYRLCSMLVRSRWLALLGIAVLTLNPYVLDFLSAARGYGLGIALMLWGVYWMLRRRTPAAKPHDLRNAGFAYGLAIASSLTLLFPIAALATVFWLTNRTWRTIDELGIPMTVSAFVLLIVPLFHATKANFYVGAQNIRDTMDSLIVCSLRHHPTSAITFQNSAIGWTPWLLAAFAFIAAIALRWSGYELCLLAASFALTIAILITAHVVVGLKYPELRTGLYLIPFVSLIALAAIAAMPWRAAQAILAIPLIAVVTLYIVQWNTSMYTEWQWDQNSRAVARIIRDRQPHRVGASWELVEALNYYRDRFRMKNLDPLTRANPDGEFDIYVLLPENYDVLTKRGLHEIYRDAKSKVVIALPPGSR